MLYYWVKIIHIDTVIFNIGFFILRFYWMLYYPYLVNKTWVRAVSQVNDTLLLVAGITMAVMSRQYPLEMPWLTAKLIGLLLYIVLGSYALKRAKNRSMRILCGVLATVTVGYIVSVALSQTPYSWVLLQS